MNWVVIVNLAVVAAAMFSVPWIARPTVPLGVSVPSTRVGDPAVRTATNRYRAGVVLSFVVIAVLAGLFTGSAPLAMAAGAPLGLLAAGLAVLVRTRRGITEAKRDGGWYDDVPVGWTASITDEPTPAVRQPWWWYAGSLAVVVATALVGVALYGRQPNPYPTHWTLAGVPDQFADKSVLTVFAVVLVMLGLVLLLALVGVLATRAPQRSYPDGDPERAGERQRARMQATATGLGVLTFAVALGLGTIQVGMWAGSGGRGQAVLMAVFLILVGIGLAVLLWLLLRSTRAERRALAGPAAGRGPAAGQGQAAATGRGGTGPRVETPDDDAHWKAGVLYVNRDDPSLMVPKRFGAGWTINLGHPAGIAVGVLLLAGIVAAVVVPLVTGS